MNRRQTATRDRYDYVVVGAGPIGASAAKYLSYAGHAVALLAPPNDQSGGGRRNSHSDQSRIARSVDADALWSALASRSIARYRELEERTGIDFFTEAGSLLVLGTTAGTTHLTVPATCERLDSRSLRRQFAYLSLAPDSVGLLERTSAGYIEPRRFIEAQIAAGQAAGDLDVLPQAMTSVSRKWGGAVVELSDGARLRGHDVLLAMGAYSRFEPMCAMARQLTIFGRTIVHLEVSASQADELSGMPTVRVRGQHHGFYLVPPLRSPDGRWYLKIGGGPRTERLESTSDVEHWCAGDGDAKTVDLLVRTATDLVPGLTPLSVRPQTCIITVPAAGRPYVGRVSTGFGVATGGNGAGAKSGDELGRLAAGMVAGASDWAEGYDRAALLPAT